LWRVWIFGALSVRVSLVDSERGLLDSALAEYPLHRQRSDPAYAIRAQVFTRSITPRVKKMRGRTRVLPQ